MTVAELIKELQKQPQDADVRICQPTHDHWRSELAAEIEDVGLAFIEHTSYHNADQIYDDELDDDGEKRSRVVLIS